MSDLETLKAQHPAIQAVLDRVQRDGNRALPEEHAVAVLANALQQHEAELAKAQETIAECEATIQEKDARIAELEHRAANDDDYECPMVHLKPTKTIKAHVRMMGRLKAMPYDFEESSEVETLRAQLHSEQQAHAATKKELRKAQETLQQQARELEEADESLYELFQSRDKEYALSGDTENCCRAAFMRLKSRHSARAQQDKSEAKKEDE